MSNVILPLRNDLPHFKFQTELEGVTYGFEFRWNHRSEAWFMSILSADDEILAGGIRVVVDHALASRFPSAALPPGVLVAQDTTGAQQDPGLSDLGTRVILLYMPSTVLE